MDDDTDATAYILYSANSHVQVEQLSPDYMSSTGVSPYHRGPSTILMDNTTDVSPSPPHPPQIHSYAATKKTSGILTPGNEAPAMFKRVDAAGHALYWSLVSVSCCYCGQGGLVHAFYSKTPLGPYTHLGEIAGGPNPFGHNNPAVVTTSQQTNVFPYTTASGEVVFVWQGDRWQVSV